MAVDPRAVGRVSDPVEVSWTADDALLYAVAVGAGQEPLRELSLTTENTAGVAQQVLPSFAALLSQRAPRPDIGEFDRSKLLHAEQHLELHAPLAEAGRVELTAEVAGIEDKGHGALVWTSVRGQDPASGRSLFTTRSAAFIRGEGGFGGERVRAPGWEAPQRPPDAVVTYATRPEQALVYRLTGDRNPLHSDPEFAARGGFEQPILHGMCTFGFTCRALVAAAGGGDPAAITGMGGRFKAPVLPGDSLDVRLWIDGRTVLFQTLRGDGTVVIDRGAATLAASADPR